MRNDNKINNTEFFKEYRGTRGISICGGYPPEKRFLYTQNMYVDYEGGGDAVESIPGFRKIVGSEKKIHSLNIQTFDRDKYLVFHSGNTLYRLKYGEEKPERIAEISDRESRIFTFGGLCLITDGVALYSLDREGNLKLVSDKDYIAGCLSCAVFDGRLFLSSNEAYKGKIFYSTELVNGDFVFSEDNCIYAGGNISSILAHGGRLWVFRNADSEGEKITCHTSEEGYPVCFTLDSISPVLRAISLKNEILVLSQNGLWAIETEAQGEVARQNFLSKDIAPLLTGEELCKADLCL